MSPKHKANAQPPARPAVSESPVNLCWLRVAVLTGVLLPLNPQASAAQSADGYSSELSRGFRFAERSGESLYNGVCQGCHMHEGEGATGAGTYPAIAGDEALGAGGYAIYVIVNGRRGMPPFGEMMSNEQVAAVANYLRTHFGNRYEDAVTADDVEAVRPLTSGGRR